MVDDGFFDEAVASTYDEDHGGADPSEAAAFLSDLAGDGRALEFAIGTGRVALSLADRGVDVVGIELSSAMIATLRAKPGGPAMTVVQGDMVTTKVPGPFSLVYLVFNTINNLTTQETQVSCFENAAHHLAPGGHFVVEVQVPPIQTLPKGERLLAFASDTGHMGTDEIDVVNQEFTSHHVWLGDGPPRQLSIPMRYVWPSELDLMARIAGMMLVARWADWSRAPFTALSSSHVSVWRKMQGT